MTSMGLSSSDLATSVSSSINSSSPSTKEKDNLSFIGRLLHSSLLFFSFFVPRYLSARATRSSVAVSLRSNKTSSIASLNSISISS